MTDWTLQNGFWLSPDGVRLPAISGGQDFADLFSDFGDFTGGGGASDLGFPGAADLATGDLSSFLGIGGGSGSFGSDPFAFGGITSGTLGGGFGPDPFGVSGAEAGAGSGDPGFFGSLTPVQKLGLMLGMGPVAVGLTGIIQQAMSGNAQARTKLTETFAKASPEQQQAIRSALQGFQQLQTFALSPQGSILTSLASQAPMQSAAMMRALKQQTQLNRGVVGTAGATVPAMLGQQQGILSGLAPVAQAMSQGTLNLSPELQKSVEMAFQPQFGDVARQAIEAARNAGFAGGADLLNQAPAAALAGPALAALQGQMAGAKLDLARQLPLEALQIAGGFSTPIAAQGGLANQMIAQLGNLGQQGFSNQLDFLRAASAPPQGLMGLGTGLQQTQGRTGITQGPPPTLLSAFAPLAQLLGGVGGLFGGIGGLSGTRSTLSGA